MINFNNIEKPLTLFLKKKSGKHVTSYVPSHNYISQLHLCQGKDKKDVFTEDWECDKCGSNNFSRRIDCFKCHARKPPIDPKHPNDWECRNCKGNNFSRRIDCFKCGEPKPRFISSSGGPGGGGGGAGGPGQEARDGSWFCDWWVFVDACDKLMLWSFLYYLYQGISTTIILSNS